MMQAIVHDRYGSPTTLEQREIAPPEVTAGRVLIRVHRAALHPGDLFAVLGSPFPVRFFSGLFRPKRGIPGLDVAGTVEAVGEGVTGFRPGDHVLGAADGSCAELTTARAQDLVHKPAGIGWDEAAALPTSGLAALHGLRAAGLRAGQRLLLIGASGGVGTFQVQLAKAMGAHVTAVGSPTNLDLLRELGADEVIDRTTADPMTSGRRWDVIIDNVEHHPLGAVRRALTEDGTLVLNSGSGAGGLRMLVRLVSPIIRSRFSRQRLRRYLSNPTPEDLRHLVDLVERGELRPVIGARYPLGATPQALERIGAGEARGKLVIEVAPTPG
jgi:NADPH:quinone reductase-like Zn-dependent oxidoreductase